jgi:hypothetical protein
MTANATSESKPPRPCGEDAGRSPAEARTLHEGEHDQHDAQRGGECAGQVKPATELALAVRGDQRERQQQGDPRERHVDEEHRLPAERLGEHATEQHADHEARGAGAAPNRHCTVALRTFREGGVDERQGGGEDERSADARPPAREPPA